MGLSVSGPVFHVDSLKNRSRCLIQNIFQVFGLHGVGIGDGLVEDTAVVLVVDMVYDL
jgi:hypothetical protein